MHDLADTSIDMDAIKRILELKQEIDETNDRLSGLKAERAQLEAELTEQYALNGVTSMACDGHTLYRTVDRYANAKPECRQEIVEWARQNGLDDMIAVNPARFKSWCKEQMDDNETLPASLVDKVTFFEKVNLRVRKS